MLYPDDNSVIDSVSNRHITDNFRFNSGMFLKKNDQFQQTHNPQELVEIRSRS